MKVCTMCDTPKDESQFRPNGRKNRTLRANCRTCDRDRHKAWRSKNREHMRQYDRKRWKTTDRWDDHIRRKYGLSPEDYVVMLLAQDGRCAICRTNEPGGNSERFHVDHIHGTTTIRGLLCSRCNRMIGLGEDSPDLLEAAIGYIVAPQAEAFIRAYMETLTSKPEQLGRDPRDTSCKE
jgi:hypothetical protein